MKAITIKNQSLSSLLSNHQVCESCRIVDRDEERCDTDYKCPKCGSESKGGVMYFHLTIHTTINLMQEAFHSEDKVSLSEKGSTPINNSHNISIVLFFCTLRELLINYLIQELCVAQNIPKLIHQRLIDDNKSYIQRQNKLLPSLIGDKWKDAITLIDEKHELDYLELNDFLKCASDARNNFMHEGLKWSISPEMGGKCIEHIWPLLNLYVALHNKYVHPNYLQI